MNQLGTTKALVELLGLSPSRKLQVCIQKLPKLNYQLTSIFPVTLYVYAKQSAAEMMSSSSCRSSVGFRMVLADILRLDITYLDRIAGRSELTELYRRRRKDVPIPCL